MKITPLQLFINDKSLELVSTYAVTHHLKLVKKNLESTRWNAIGALTA